MNWIIGNIEGIMIGSGLLTATMLYAMIAPQAALRSTFGETLEGPLAEIVGFVPRNIDDGHGLSIVWIAAQRKSATGRCCRIVSDSRKFLVGFDDHLRLPDPKSLADAHLMSWLFFTETLIITRRATHHETARR